MLNKRLSAPGIILFISLASLILYVMLYVGIEHTRAIKGAWRVTFTNDSRSMPVLRVDESGLKISGVEIVFNGKTTVTNNGVRVFDKMREVPFALPFGECKFQELNFLPGTVVLEVCGHEIQFMPRKLTIDKTQELPWISGQRIFVDQ